MPTSATDPMLPGAWPFCRWIAWNAAAQASATLRVSLTFCEDSSIVGAEIRNFGLTAPDGTHTALPTGSLPPKPLRIARCTRSWMPAPRWRLTTASTPPSIRPRELVGLTQASTTSSRIEPLRISIPGVSANAARHASTTVELVSVSTTLSGDCTRFSVMVDSDREAVSLVITKLSRPADSAAPVAYRRMRPAGPGLRLSHAAGRTVGAAGRSTTRQSRPPQYGSTLRRPSTMSDAQAPATPDPNDPLALAELFAGGGEPWLPLLKPVIEAQPGAAAFIGPGRGQDVVPVRELTFQALKPNAPHKWKVVVFGQNPYPRPESATGIAMFDNTFHDWKDSQFGRVVSIRCIIKAAAMWKYGIPKKTPIADVRALLKKQDTVQPPEWFQAMLTQGVLLLNAALTASSDGTTGTDRHTAFWRPAAERIVEEILRAKQNADEEDRGVVFAWWGRTRAT